MCGRVSKFHWCSFSPGARRTRRMKRCRCGRVIDRDVSAGIVQIMSMIGSLLHLPFFSHSLFTCERNRAVLDSIIDKEEQKKENKLVEMWNTMQSKQTKAVEKSNDQGQEEGETETGKRRGNRRTGKKQGEKRVKETHGEAEKEKIGDKRTRRKGKGNPTRKKQKVEEDRASRAGKRVTDQIGQTKEQAGRRVESSNNKSKNGNKKNRSKKNCGENSSKNGNKKNSSKKKCGEKNSNESKDSSKSSRPRSPLTDKTPVDIGKLKEAMQAEVAKAMLARQNREEKRRESGKPTERKRNKKQPSKKLANTNNRKREREKEEQLEVDSDGEESNQPKRMRQSEE
eukprot:TRINITY_DN3052_c0_g1_i1.p1 TRINITY_DN3052_c0_g1~~TRINITY_DN3052_c0_g1_i1.p1  ORF type:complete len:341 (+),score=109.57 TRINITY_DN3052_c0_g1_i1:133-1155(+)